MLKSLISLVSGKYTPQMIFSLILLVVSLIFVSNDMPLILVTFGAYTVFQFFSLRSAYSKAWTFKKIIGYIHTLTLFFLLTGMFLIKANIVASVLLILTVIPSTFLIILLMAAMPLKDTVTRARNFKDKKELILLSIVMSYVIFSFTVIVTFGAIYSYIGKDCFDGIGVVGENPWNYIYFSSESFYSSYGEVKPLCSLSRLTTQVEMAISNIFHIIILGWIITEVLNPPKNSGDDNGTSGNRRR